MKKLLFFGALLPMLCLGACGGGAKSAAVADADTLVLAMGYRPNTKLADDLAAAGVATHVLGDAQKCGNIRDAIGDGYKVACEL